MEFTANQIASFIQGKVEGDENAIVNTFAKIEEGKPFKSQIHTLYLRNTIKYCACQRRR